MATQLESYLQSGGVKAYGFATPKEDKAPQVVRVPPKRVIPIIFLPGIMGSNLRVNPQRQSDLGNANNAVWRPGKVGEVASLLYGGPTRRQVQLDQQATEVDDYNPNTNPTGSPDETSDDRNSEVDDINVSLTYQPNSPLLAGDPTHGCFWLSFEERARRRGWGEIFFSSYRKLLETLEQALNDSNGAERWKEIVNTDPSTWQAHPERRLRPLTDEEIRNALKGCFFPVHAMGYNWLKSNHESALAIKGRLEKLIDDYNTKGFKCEKVIILTHSMGGLVARALSHPAIGNYADKILGVVHGVLPAIGAPAAYKRMRCGFEEKLGGLDPIPKIIGNKGSEVTAVLGNSAGGLQLLPSKAYGNGWLQVRQQGILFGSFPQHGDPYEEIYKLRNRWYGLIREEWINPSNLGDATFERTCGYLDEARDFHDTLGDYYHPRTYAHYCADPGQASWESVVWNIHRDFTGRHWTDLSIVKDNLKGELKVSQRNENGHKSLTTIKLGAAAGPGDQTVPLKSAEHQLLKGALKGAFRQTGYEHQQSYNNERALNSTLYCVVKIVQKMWWTDGER